MGEDLLVKASVVIAASVGAAAIFARLRSPPAVGYLVAGALIGPHGLGLLQLESETEFLAELGVILLMFMVGPEFSLSTMFKARDDVFIAGGLNVAVVGAAGALCAFALGASPLAAILLGAALAMSSTAMTVKALADRGEISTTFGRYALAILIFQDLAALPFLVAADGDASAAADPQRLIAPLFIALTFVIAAMLFWKPVFGAMLSSVARTRHADFFLLTVLLVAIGAAGAADLAGLAPTIGAFLAGMVIGESDFRHRVEDDIRPFRDVLVGFFFVTVGMQVDVTVIVAAFGAVMASVVALTVGKAMITFGLLAAMRRPLHASVRTALILAHGGEFGLLLLTQATRNGAVDRAWSEPLIAAIAISLALAPLLISQSGAVAKRLAMLLGPRADAPEPAVGGNGDLAQHVILCGCGRLGRLVAHVMDTAGIRYVALESDLGRYQVAKRAGAHVIYGDAARAHALEAAGFETADLIVVTFDRGPAVAKLLERARQRHPVLASIVSAADDRDMVHVIDLGAQTVFPENLAAGLTLADQILVLLGKTQDEAAYVITQVRGTLNPELGDRVGR